LGLVDKIGTLRDALDHVATQAKLKDYEIRVVPDRRTLSSASWSRPRDSTKRSRA